MPYFTITYTLTIDKLHNTYQITRKTNKLIESSSIEEVQEEINKLGYK